MPIPVLFHDPTSEPSRAVHWLAIEADIELEMRYVWLTRGEHKSPELLRVNPAQQVPAIQHGELCLAEAAAIMVYLAELNGVSERWVGATPEERGHTNRFLSWHHTNTRLRLTLEYVLPVLLMPAYHGATPPPAHEVRRLRDRGRESLELLEWLLAGRGAFLGGSAPSVADLFVASDLYALDVDPDRDGWFAGLPAVSDWLARLRDRNGYCESHGAWNAILPRITTLLESGADTPRNPGWVADACAPHLA